MKKIKRIDKGADILFMDEAGFKLGMLYKQEGRNPGLIKCPSCHRENYAMCVSKGICAWCGFDSADLEQFCQENLNKVKDVEC